MDKLWITFKYENLPSFCYRCGKMAHGLKECPDHSHAAREIVEEDLPYSSVLKAESMLMGKEWYKFNGSSNKSMPQHSYTSSSHDSKNVTVMKNVTPKSIPMVDEIEKDRSRDVDSKPVWKVGI